MAQTYWFDYKGTAINRIGDGGAYIYRTSYVALDADGSPRAYHPDGIGIDANANAGYPNKSWRDVLVVDPADPERPYVQPDGKYAGYFVSKTSLRSRKLPDTDPRAYVDSELFPYIVFPGAFYAIKGTGEYGDLVMARAIGTKFETCAIVADGGPKESALGEMSLALAVALGGKNPNPRSGTGAPKGIFEYIVFPKSAATPAWPRDLGQIDAEARKRLADLGGWPT